MRYITYDIEGAITGFYIQDVLPEHSDCYLEVGADIQQKWVNCRMSDDRKSIVDMPFSMAIGPLKDQVNQEINSWRLMMNQTSFPFDGKRIACGGVHRSDLDGIANYINLFGEYPVDFPLKWKTVDNTYIDLPEIQDFKDMYAAMVDQGNANFKRAQQLKAALAAASTHEAVEAVREAIYNEQ